MPLSSDTLGSLVGLLLVIMTIVACSSAAPADDARTVAVEAFVDHWSAGDIESGLALLDPAAIADLEAAAVDGDASQFSRPGWYLDAASDDSVDLAAIFDAVERAGGSLIDLGNPIISVSSLDASTVEMEFDARSPVHFTLNEQDDGWRIRRIDEPDPSFIGDVFGVADPAAGTGWTWCGSGEPVVLPEVDCGRVLAGLEGITDAEHDRIADLRQQSVDDPSQALALTQAMQQILASAPGQVCRLLQRGEVPAGEAEARAAELERTVCPAFEPLELSR